MKRNFIVLLVILFVSTLSVANAYVWPTQSKTITSWYGYRGDFFTNNGNKATSFHEAIDIGAAEGSICVAVGDGIIKRSEYNQYNGNFVVLELNNGCQVYYLHFSKRLVKAGDKVVEGQVIGKTGSTGNVTGPHLCFRVKKNGSFMNLNSYVSEYLGIPVPSGKPTTSTTPITGTLGATAVNSCTIVGCGGKIVDKWEHSIDRVGGGTHYKVCSVNSSHHFLGDVFYWVDGKCSLCGKNKTDNSTVVDNKVTYENKLFSDLPSNHWAYNEVKEMKEVGIVAGKPDGTLGVDDKITAEEFIVLLSQVVQKKGMTKNIGEAYLEDEMDVNYWSYDSYIKLMQVLGNKSSTIRKMGEKEVKLILGNTTEQVLKNYKKPITREKVASLMSELINESSTSVNILGAKDWNSVNSIYKKAINELASKGIFKGVLNDGNIYIYPNVEVTRVEAVVLISRLYKNL